MKVNEKIIVAFLVSAGVFSVSVATKYVGGLSNHNKKAMLSAAKMSSSKVLYCEGTDLAKYSKNRNIV